MEAGDLVALHSFIEEQGQWLQSVLDTLGWTRDSLQQQGQLMQCPYNKHHFVAKTSIERHKIKCRYGAVGMASDHEPEGDTDSSTLVSISSSVVEAIKKYAAKSDERVVQSAQPVQKSWEWIDQSDVVLESHDRVPTLESQAATPPDLLTQDPLHTIRYIKAWPVVPSDFAKVSSTSINPVEVKAWLFRNLPENHSFSSQLGGEMQAAEVVLQTLTSQPSLTPDTLVTKLTPLFAQYARSFVLRLWKFLHTVALQRQHTILDSAVAELSPLPLSALSFLSTDPASKPTADSFAEKIQEIAAESECPSSPLPNLPMDCVPHILSTLERKLLYDYMLEVGGTVPGSQSKDPSLFRDDAAAIKAKLKQRAMEESEGLASEGKRVRGRETNLYQMKRERDYKRRRQKYRARNVHITRRTPAQVMRDIINARMAEIKSSIIDHSHAEEKKTPTASEKDEVQQETKLPNPKRESETIGPTREAGECHAERAERKWNHDSRPRHREREEKSVEEREHQSQPSESRDRSRRDSGRSRSRERRKRSRSASRNRHHHRHHRKHSHSDSHEREKHRKKKSSRDRRSSNTSEGYSESRNKALSQDV